MKRDYWFSSGEYGGGMYIAVDGDKATLVEESWDLYDEGPPTQRTELYELQWHIDNIRDQLASENACSIRIGSDSWDRGLAERFLETLERIENEKKAHALVELPAAAFIFDKDGTLLDTESVWFEAYRRLLDPYGIQHDVATHREMLGLSGDVCIALLQSAHAQLSQGKTAAKQLVRERSRLFHLVRMGAGVRLMDGVTEFLRAHAKRGIPFAIATSASRKDTDAELQFLGWENLFKVVVTAEDVSLHKPAPDVYLEAARRLGVDPSECVAFEDGLNGIKSARAAGIKVVFVRDKRYNNAPVKDVFLEVSSFKDLLREVDR